MKSNLIIHKFNYFCLKYIFIFDYFIILIFLLNIILLFIALIRIKRYNKRINDILIKVL